MTVITHIILKRTPMPHPEKSKACECFAYELRGLGCMTDQLTEDKGDGTAFPRSECHECAMNTVQEGLTMVRKQVAAILRSIKRKNMDTSRTLIYNRSADKVLRRRIQLDTDERQSKHLPESVRHPTRTTLWVVV